MNKARIAVNAGYAENLRLTGKGVGIAGGPRPVHIARMAEAVRRAPQEADARLLHQALDVGDHLLQIAAVLLIGAAEGRDVHIVKAEKRDLELPHKFKCGVRLPLGLLQRRRPRIPSLKRLCPERVRKTGAPG